VLFGNGTRGGDDGADDGLVVTVYWDFLVWGVIWTLYENYRNNRKDVDAYLCELHVPQPLMAQYF
jgi:hypothetical protein